MTERRPHGPESGGLPPDALISIVPDGTVRSWNRAGEEIFGYSRAEAIGRSYFDLIVPPDRRDEARAKLRETLETGLVAYESVRHRKDGVLLQVDITQRVVANTEGLVDLVVISDKDVTGRYIRHRAERLGAQFGGLLEGAPDAMVIVNEIGRIVLANGPTETLFGYSRRELMGKPIEMLVPERFRESHVRQRAGYLADPWPRRMGAGLELFGCRKDGTEFPVEISLSPLQSDEGALAMGAIRDITQRKKADAKFRGLLESAQDAIVIVNQTGVMVFVNTQAETMFGYARHELVGQPIETLVPDHTRDRHPGYRSRYTSNPHPRPMGAGLELHARRKDGTEFPVEISLSPMDTEDGPLVTAAVRDITERRQLESQRRQANELATRRAHEASRLKSEFLANMSHELRTPINAIMGFAELMHDGKIGEVSEEQREFLGDILTSSRHLLQLINDVLDLSKVEAGKMEFRPERVEPAKVVAEVSDVLRTLAATKRIRVATEVAPHVGEIVVDPGKLKQVLYNYLSNALKFTPEGGHVTVRVLTEEPDSFRLEVEDTGIGIRPEDLGHLFVEFQQLDASTAKKYPGTGLGLALTKRLVDTQGGRVGVRSEIGKGSVFFAVLPRVTLAPQEAADEPDGSGGPPEPGGPSILVIEDDATDRNWLAQTLTTAGYAVETVATGTAAVERAGERAFDAITLDLLLPDMPGQEVLRAVRAQPLNRGTPVVVVTIAAEAGRGIGTRVDDILVKPIDSGQLLDALERAGVRRNATRSVLVLDDDENALKLALQVLTGAGFRCVAYGDSETALGATVREAPAAVVLDLLMPKMDGFEFLSRLRGLPDGRAIPVIVWTGKDLTARERAGLKASAQAVVLKTEGITAVLRELESLITTPRTPEPQGGRRGR